MHENEHDRLHIVVIAVSDAEYAIPVHRVKGILASTDLEHVPGADRTATWSLLFRWS
jgi:chemotaxis signal transduction protein